jgi:hypothetical protein
VPSDIGLELCNSAAKGGSELHTLRNSGKFSPLPSRKCSRLPSGNKIHTAASQASGALEGARRRLEAYVDSLDMEQATFEAAEAKLKEIKSLLKECDCGTVAELLDMAEGAQAALEQWSRLAGEQQPRPSGRSAQTLPDMLALVSSAFLRFVLSGSQSCTEPVTQDAALTFTGLTFLRRSCRAAAGAAARGGGGARRARGDGARAERSEARRQ